MYILSNEEMSAIDKRTIYEFNIPGEVLMEKAGKAVADGIEEFIGDISNKSAIIVCGKGNNGGDGYVVARRLYLKGCNVTVLMCADQRDIHGDAKGMLERLPKDISMVDIDEAEKGRWDIVVDAVFGTGFKGEVDTFYERVIKLINSCGEAVISVDIPSGVNGNTGAVAKECVQADYTFTFCMEKIGHRLYPGKSRCGKTVVCDISIPKAAVEGQMPKMKLFTKSDMSRLMRPLSISDHKGVNGKVLIIGGSVGMAGSVCMAAMAAMRAGAGLCYVAVPESIHSVVATKLTEAITLPLVNGKNGCIGADNVQRLEPMLDRVDAVVVGCGMSVNDDTIMFLNRLIDKLKAPVIFDADGLNILAKNMEYLDRCKVPAILTPHTVEMSRLLGIKPNNVLDDRIGSAFELANGHNAVVLLKGDGTITTNGEKGYINTTGNPGMATGGSGDVLSGIIGAMVAGGMDTFMGAACGAFIHGLAGDYAAEQASMRGMIATDIIKALPLCFKDEGHGLS